ncbi:SDR family oxidoreductase [bacterium]|nr:SDR family oxidoreductase [bacterium]
MSNPIRTRCLVTGGAGFIGSHLVERLVADGHSVAVLDSFVTGKHENLANVRDRIDLFEGPTNDPEICRRAVEGAELVFHEAAIPSVPRSVREPIACHEANVTGTVVLLDACREAGVRRLVYAGSSSAYGDLAVESKSEDLKPEPLSPYAAAKLAGEHYLRAYHEVHGLETVVLRYFNVFGPRQDPTSEYSAVIPKFITAMLEGKRPTIYGDGTQSRDFTYIDNVVHANLLAATSETGVGGVFNAACGGAYTLLDLMTLLKELLDSPIEPMFEPARAGDVKHSLADISAARKALGYDVIVDFKEGLRRTAEYYRGLQ